MMCFELINMVSLVLRLICWSHTIHWKGEGGGGHWSCPFVYEQQIIDMCAAWHLWWGNLFTQRTKSTDMCVSPLWRHTCSQAEGFYDTVSWCICLLRPYQILLWRREARQLRGDGGTAEGKAELINDEHDRRIKGKKRSWRTIGGSGEERLMEMMNPHCQGNEESGIAPPPRSSMIKIQSGFCQGEVWTCLPLIHHRVSYTNSWPYMTIYMKNLKTHVNKSHIYLPNVPPFFVRLTNER